ncbi:MAG: inorganic diphosphatase [Candidatus Hydrogenedentes bacterium]|nr:inorganic diphosphatase [Candidatus Hydrogenedentota bacterium]
MRFIAATLIAISVICGTYSLIHMVAAAEFEHPLPPIQQACEVFSKGLGSLDFMTYAGPKHLIDGYPARNEDGTVNVVVEIPAGTGSKWEVKADGNLHWDIKAGKPRIVQYLPYPCNYGMIPGTSAADGDPIDAVILGPAVPRGSIVPTRIIGLLKLTDKGEQDDKIVTVMDDTPLAHITTISQLQAEFPGICEILEEWFVNYKGPGAMPFGGMGDAGEADAALRAVLKEAAAAP